MLGRLRVKANVPRMGLAPLLCLLACFELTALVSTSVGGGGGGGGGGGILGLPMHMIILSLKLLLYVVLRKRLLRNLLQSVVRL